MWPSKVGQQGDWWRCINQCCQLFEEVQEFNDSGGYFGVGHDSSLKIAILGLFDGFGIVLAI